MKKIITIYILVCFFGCVQNQKSNSEIYTARKEFGVINNKISKTSLDSIISNSPHLSLDNYKTTDLKVTSAIEFLKKELGLKGFKANEFFIYEIKNENDSVLVFHLNHIDSYVYNYNLEKKNLELSKNSSQDGMIKTIPPISGNVSGQEGWYKVNFEKRKIEIYYAQ